jgi:hypothetical protein
MAVIDSGAAQVMHLSSELIDAQATIRRQRRQLLALAGVVRAQQVALATMADLTDALLAGDDG